MSDIGTRFERLVEIMRVLRSPEGCPWDRKQTHASLRRFVLEETYEVLEAIDEGDPAHLREELGDFLFEAVFLAQLSEEAGDFTIGDAIDTVCEKLVRRHPHVFDRAADESPLTSDEVVDQWAVIKARERAAAGTPTATPSPTLSGVPATLPGLLRAFELSTRAASVGFDWKRPVDVIAKIEEEVQEVRTEVESGALGAADRAEAEVGDLLFAITNLSRQLGIEPEAALRRANDTFTARFEAMERSFAAKGTPLSEATIQEMERAWANVKADERAAGT